MSAEELNKIKKSLRSVLISCPEGTPINKVEIDYKTFMGVSLSYQQFGHSNVESFMRSIPDTVRFSGAITYGVACEEIKHVAKLINNQRKVTSAVKRVQRARNTKYYPQSQPFQNAPRPQGGSYNKYPPRQPPHYTQQYKPPMHYPSYPTFAQYRPPSAHGPPSSHGPPPTHGPLPTHGPHGHHGPPPSAHGHHGTYVPPPQQVRYAPFYSPVGPPMPPRTMHPSAPGPQYLPISPPPVQEDIAEELIFSDNEIIDLLLKEKIPKSPQLVQILSIAFPYIYRGSHIAIIELSIPLCIDIATAVALDLEEELDGTPAILVVKMQEFHDFGVLESSESVERFNSHVFRNTKAKVITLSFLDMISLLNTNNEHFYKSTTYVIFVDVHEGHMPLLNTLLPPELQYLFLFTCVNPQPTLYTQPYVMIRKLFPNKYTDVAYGHETLIENLTEKLKYLNECIPVHTQIPPKVIQASPVVNGDLISLMSLNDAKSPSPALNQLTAATLKANINLFIQAGPSKGKTSLLLELAVNKVDVALDQLQIVLTAPNPKSSGQLFVRLKDYVYAKELTEVRAFGYTEGSFEKLNLYLEEQKVHILVIENSHLFSLMVKNSTLLKHCKLLGCDELYGSFYSKQVPTTIANCFGKLYSHSTQVVVMSHPSENEDLLQPHIPKPSWHIKEHASSTAAKEKYTVTFFNAN